jgi:hypothetical protein
MTAGGLPSPASRDATRRSRVELGDQTAHVTVRPARLAWPALPQMVTQTFVAEQ